MTHRSSRLCAVVVAALLATTVVDGAAAQADADSLSAQVDQLFAHLDKPDSPGCTCAVMRDGEIVYSSAFGMANLELSVPLTPQSVFFVASVSKQFTAASVALLAIRGQLSLDDDIRKYLPEMHEFEDTITVRHLVHHISGLRGDDLRAFVGWWSRSSNARNLAALSRQRTVNFRPGEEYSYNGFGYVLLAEIVERVSGQSLREFAEENLFSPLGMANTQFDDNYHRVVKNRVQSYGSSQGKPWRYLRKGHTVGPYGLLSTAEDLLRWNRNFDDMTVGGPAFVELMLTRGTVNNGDTIHYAFGLVHDEYRGLKTVRHGGAGMGFRIQLMRFPEQGFGLVVLCNSTTIDYGPLVRGIADTYLRDEFEAAATEDEARPVPVAVAVSTSELEKVTGIYWNEKDHLVRRIYLKNDTLRYFRPSGSETKMMPLGNDQFYMVETAVGITMVSFTTATPGDPRQMIVVVDDEWQRAASAHGPYVYHGLEPASPSAEELEDYLGTYYSEDADYQWVLRITNERLTMWDPQTWDETVLRPVGRDVFRLEGWGFFFFFFSRDDQGRVVGFAVETETERNLLLVRR